jgi:hypothetical protein
VRLRRSAFMADYFVTQGTEEKEIQRVLDDLIPQ